MNPRLLEPDSGLLLLLIREDLKDKQIYDFQWKIDQFAQGWFQINMGNEGMTNYLHDLHAGHIIDYLVHRRDLYTHSQQGWENMNFAIKRYWFRYTLLLSSSIQVSVDLRP
jgi:hypothetical protein